MLYPAIDVTGADPELVLAVIDDFSPTAVEEHADSLTVYFATIANRDAAQHALAVVFPAARTNPREVDDEDWARQSQENLQPVTVGDITIVPRPHSELPIPNSTFQIPNSKFHFRSLVILPSMGFGTGHHQTTRLCLAAMQSVALKPSIAGGTVLDVGTGSGILALAARLLGAAQVTGIDFDADAIHSAEENLQLNSHLGPVAFETADLRTWLEREDNGQGRADVVTANLTGALLAKSASLLVRAVRPGGHLVLSGLLKTEETLVSDAFVERTRLGSITSEDEWVCLVLKKP